MSQVALNSIYVRPTRAAQTFATTGMTARIPRNSFYRNKYNYNPKERSASKLETPDKTREQQAKCGAQHVGRPVV